MNIAAALELALTLLPQSQAAVNAIVESLKNGANGLDPTSQQIADAIAEVQELLAQAENDAKQD